MVSYLDGAVDATELYFALHWDMSSLFLHCYVTALYMK